ncbi:hypothetical protein [Streptomyces prunicolor]|uniref:hypothetical protein n=1 Tax=Streptomyces prunicolor TaxID=67348 RepID=UPI0033C27B30
MAEKQETGELAAEKLGEWLRRLTIRPDGEAGRQIMEGRALSRSESHVHFATSEGVLAIPVEDIEDVFSRFPDDSSRVSLALSSSANILRLRRPLWPRRYGVDPGPIVIIGPGVNTTVCTTTYTGAGDETTCDDDGCVDSADDLGQ